VCQRDPKKRIKNKRNSTGLEWYEVNGWLLGARKRRLGTSIYGELKRFEMPPLRGICKNQYW